MGSPLTAVAAKKLISTPNREQIITDRMVDWLDKNTHIPLIKEDMPLIESLLLDSTNHERGGRFGASSRGTCERAQVFGFLGFKARGATIDYRLANIFIDGQWRHLRWQLMMIKAGVMEEAEVTFNVPELRLGTSLDGVNWTEELLFEIKGDGSYRAVNAPTEAHDLQIHTYFLASGLRTAIYFVEKKGTNEWTEIVVRPNPVSMKLVEDELERLNKAVDNEQLPSQLPDCKAKTGQVWRQCQYRDNCGTATWDSATATRVKVRRSPATSRIKKRSD